MRLAGWFCAARAEGGRSGRGHQQLGTALARQQLSPTAPLWPCRPRAHPHSDATGQARRPAGRHAPAASGDGQRPLAAAALAQRGHSLGAALHTQGGVAWAAQRGSSGSVAAAGSQRSCGGCLRQISGHSQVPCHPCTAQQVERISHTASPAHLAEGDAAHKRGLAPQAARAKLRVLQRRRRAGAGVGRRAVGSIGEGRGGVGMLLLLPACRRPADACVRARSVEQDS